MGNCMQKKIVLEIDEVKNDSQEYIRRKEDGDVECDINGSIVANNNNVANSIDLQNQSVLQFDHNVNMDDFQNRRPLNRPPPSAFMEKHNRKSHPLPTPNLASHAYNNDNNRASFLPLPKPETSPNNNTKPDDESSSITATPIIPEASSATCRLPMPISESEILSSPYLKAFSFDEIRKATANFSEDSLLGEGGFGCVFKGWLDVETLTAARPGSGLASEVNYLGRLRHPNVVKLIGFCIDGDDRILVYEFMPGGSLERHLFKRHSPSLSWARRIKVAVGAARGLCFLHESKSPVIYRDFKTSNILLDSEFNAKLSDFGLAKAGPTESQTHVTTRVMGTEGYCDPRYLATGRLTVKCDVYSFGVVLLESLLGACYR
ncbi:hypothetical protein DH2020_019464 [Rehmannia glutinosa]|uniref:Protein kinase domain-containing protein n=1 Tax=Rehmannia glutinosa TaxID=99300 RepID=A0ABR0WM40_REHGL